MGELIHLRKKPKPLKLGDRRENFNKKFESIKRKKIKIEQMKNDMKKGK